MGFSPCNGIFLSMLLWDRVVCLGVRGHQQLSEPTFKKTKFTSNTEHVYLREVS